MLLWETESHDSHLFLSDVLPSTSHRVPQYHTQWTPTSHIPVQETRQLIITVFWQVISGMVELLQYVAPEPLFCESEPN